MVADDPLPSIDSVPVLPEPTSRLLVEAISPPAVTLTVAPLGMAQLVFNIIPAEPLLTLRTTPESMLSAPPTFNSIVPAARLA